MVTELLSLWLLLLGPGAVPTCTTLSNSAALAGLWPATTITPPSPRQPPHPRHHITTSLVTSHHLHHHPPPTPPSSSAAMVASHSQPHRRRTPQPSSPRNQHHLSNRHLHQLPPRPTRIGVLSGANYDDKFMINHKNQTCRWLSTFKDVWWWYDSCIFAGNMNRGVDVISREKRRLVTTLESPSMTAVPCRFDACPFKPGCLQGPQVDAMSIAGTHSGHIELMELLLSVGVHVDSQSDSGTPLVWAAVKLLLKHKADAGANVNTTAGGATPLHVAAEIGNTELITRLIKAKADPSVTDDEEGLTPVQMAAGRGPDGIKRATCIQCTKVLSHEHGTSNIRRHIGKCVGVDLSNKADAPPPKRICLDQAKFKEKLAISIIKHNYPFTYVEHEGTRDLHKFLHPDANPICRNTTKKEVLRIYGREKVKVKKELEKIKDNTTNNNNGLVDCLKDQLSYDALVCNGKFIHVRCCAHVLNLIVHSGLKVIEESTEKVRESVKFVRGSGAKKIKFAECIARLKLQYRKNVRQDVVTIWNYTYLMLDCRLMYRPAYGILAKLDKTFKTCPTEEEWTRIEAIAMFLKPFYDITKLFSGTLYSTSNLYFHNVYKIQKSIQRHMLNPDPVVSGMTKDMKTKFDKYWETYTMVLSFGAILDPWYKLNIVEFYLSELGMEGLLLIGKVQSVDNGLRKLYSAYEIQPNVMQGSTKGPVSNVGGGKLCDDAKDDLAGFETFQKSTFSIGGRIISKYRSSLCSSNAEALLCTRDWLFDLKDEDEVDEKELIDEDIAKLVKSSSKLLAIAKSLMVLVRCISKIHRLIRAPSRYRVLAAEEKKKDKEESDDEMGFSLID
uniref:Zinc finger BED domain-containing protein RICESLEEPER 2-like n=1 Tax=Tanacetum cinerariifolium TaxID=118510 RepID=A0A6L2KC00_TANCI|nr:zinc finger BED domain-containing protein RICESLEEPER 2-like [Tanacetum cinerariifolium]